MARVLFRAGWRPATFWAMTLVLLGLWLSGALLWVWPLQTWFDAELALTRSAVVVHGVLAWPCCVLLGRAVWPHLGLVWPRRQTQAQGAWACGVLLLVLLALWLLSGLVLLYGSAAAQAWVSPWHSSTGLAWPLVYLAHVGLLAFARRRSQPRAAPGAGPREGAQAPSPGQPPAPELRA